MNLQSSFVLKSLQLTSPDESRARGSSFRWLDVRRRRPYLTPPSSGGLENKKHAVQVCSYTTCFGYGQHFPLRGQMDSVILSLRCGDSRCVGGLFTCAGARELALSCTAVFCFLKSLYHGQKITATVNMFCNWQKHLNSGGITLPFYFTLNN